MVFLSDILIVEIVILEIDIVFLLNIEDIVSVNSKITLNFLKIGKGLVIFLYKICRYSVDKKSKDENFRTFYKDIEEKSIVDNSNKIQNVIENLDNRENNVFDLSVRENLINFPIDVNLIEVIIMNIIPNN